MWTAGLLSFLLAVIDTNTKSTNALIIHGFFGVPKIRRGKLVSPKPISQEATSHPKNSAGMRASCYCRAANNAEKMNSIDTASSVPERSKEEPWYWINETCDHNLEVTFQDEAESEDEQEKCKSKQILKLRLKIYGNPRPLQRHRTSRRQHTYNPSVKYQKSFQEALKKVIFDFRGESIDAPFFDATEFLAMSIIFRMKRPKSHFVNNKPGPGRLKKKSPSDLSPIRADVDNLIKFVLDSMNGIMYEDDRQITSIHATKLLDNVDQCGGSIEVYVRSIEVEDVEKLLESSISIIDQDTE